MIIVNYLFYALFLLAMGYYAITNLQWYSYKLERVMFHHMIQITTMIRQGKT